MAKDDWWGLGGMLFCFAVATIDVHWRLYWTVAGVGLAIWTIVSVLRRD